MSQNTFQEQNFSTTRGETTLQNSGVRSVQKAVLKSKAHLQQTEFQNLQKVTGES